MPSTEQTPNEDSGPQGEPIWGDGEIEQDAAPNADGGPSVDPNTGDDVSFGDSLRNFGSTFVESGERVLVTGARVIESGIDGIERTVEQTIDSLQKGAVQTKDALVGTVAKALDWVAADPELGPSTLEEISTIAPVVGAGKAYANAWAKYHRGKETGNEQMQREAERDCLIVCANGGLDVASLGAGALARSSRLIGKVLKFTTVTHLASNLKKVKVDLINPVADKALESPSVRRMMRGFLEAVPPSKRKTDEETAVGESADVETRGGKDTEL